MNETHIAKLGKFLSAKIKERIKVRKFCYDIIIDNEWMLFLSNFIIGWKFETTYLHFLKFLGWV